MHFATPTIRRRLRTLVWALAVLPATLAGADEKVLTTALAGDGRLVSLVHGSYGELFPGGSEARADVSVLALRWTSADGDEHMEAVPATLDQDSEDSAELVVMPDSGVSFVFWQSWSNLIQSRFRISSFDGETWTDPIEVTGSAFSWRTSPAFGISRGDFLYDGGEGGAVRVARTVLHVLWSEETAGGLWLTKYAPLVLEDGEYVGSHPILVLNDLVDAPTQGAVGDLRIAPVLRQGRAGDAMVAAFFDPRSGRLASVELRFADGELSLLGDAVAEEIDRVGIGDGATLRSAVRDRLSSYADHVKPEILNPLVTDLDEYLRGRLAEKGSDLASIRDEARFQLIDVGFRATDGRMRRATAEARFQLIDVGARRDVARRHDARVSVASTRPLGTPTPAVPEILVSGGGTKLILAWAEKAHVRYRESSVGGWSEPQEIRLTEKLDRAAAMTILHRRVDQ